jgi:hypothetical protein
MTYQEFAVEHDGDSESPRLDVACPECGWVLRIVDDDAAVGHWYLACPCGWEELGRRVGIEPTWLQQVRL